MIYHKGPCCPQAVTVTVSTSRERRRLWPWADLRICLHPLNASNGFINILLILVFQEILLKMQKHCAKLGVIFIGWWWGARHQQIPGSCCQACLAYLLSSRTEILKNKMCLKEQDGLFFLHPENVLKDVLVLSESPQIYFISPILEWCKSLHPDAAQ